MVVTKGFLETKDIRTTIFFDITVLIRNTGNSPKTRASDRNDDNFGRTWNYREWDGLRGKGQVYEATKYLLLLGKPCYNSQFIIYR
jgi:hypothetical protein